MGYWVLKTRASQSNRQDFTPYWDRFVAECVIAIGWEKLDVAPDKASEDEIIAAVKRAYNGSDKASVTAARTIRKFVSIAEGDRVLLCQGYAPNQVKEVHLYGIAQVAGPFYRVYDSDWWHFKHKAKIHPFGPNGKDVSKELLVRRLAKGALLQTLHRISEEAFKGVVEEIS